GGASKMLNALFQEMLMHWPSFRCVAASTRDRSYRNTLGSATNGTETHSVGPRRSLVPANRWSYATEKPSSQPRRGIPVLPHPHQSYLYMQTAALYSAVRHA